MRFNTDVYVESVNNRFVTLSNRVLIPIEAFSYALNDEWPTLLVETLSIRVVHFEKIRRNIFYENDLHLTDPCLVRAGLKGWLVTEYYGLKTAEAMMFFPTAFWNIVPEISAYRLHCVVTHGESTPVRISIDRAAVVAFHCMSLEITAAQMVFQLVEDRGDFCLVLIESIFDIKMPLHYYLIVQKNIINDF